MRRRAVPGILLLAALTAVPVAAGQPAGTPEAVPQPAGALRGSVSADATPLGRATVFAYELAKLQVHRVTSGSDGAFRFDQLPAGVYKLIAFKVGYEPAVVMLSRAAADALQVVELKLVAEEPGDARRAEGFWTVRDQIPADVLRDIESDRLAAMTALPESGLTTRGFSTAVRAETGVEDLAGGDSGQVAGGGIGMQGRIGAMEVGVTGEYWQLAGDAANGLQSAGGEATALNVRMSASGQAEIDMTNVRQHLPRVAGLGDSDSADFERYRVSWSQPFGERSRSRFEAQYVTQSNFFLAPTVVASPSQTRAFNVEGAYSIDITEGSALEAGLRYRERDNAYGPLQPVGEPSRALELFGRGDLQVRPSVLVEYGLATQMRDGSLALSPQGGVVVQLGPRWQAIGSVSQRLEDGAAPPVEDFTPVRFSNASQPCHDLDQHCYRVLLARQGKGDDMLAIGGVHRELAETLHLYFDDDFLNQLEGLYLVRGDEIPEVQLVVERHVAPRVLARLESTYADGGGGVLYAIDETPYENKVRYLVTSFDTRFQSSRTGVFVAFHHLEQGAEPIAEAQAAVAAVSPMELQRLQLMLSQDLNVLMRLAADWAVHVNFEVSRGALPYTLQDAAADELRRRVTGGLSVKF